MVAVFHERTRWKLGVIIKSQEAYRVNSAIVTPKFEKKIENLLLTTPSLTRRTVSDTL